MYRLDLTKEELDLIKFLFDTVDVSCDSASDSLSEKLREVKKHTHDDLYHEMMAGEHKGG